MIGRPRVIDISPVERLRDFKSDNNVKQLVLNKLFLGAILGDFDTKFFKEHLFLAQYVGDQ